MKDYLVQRLRQPSDFYFTDQMTAKKANALYTSLLQDGADAIEKLEADQVETITAMLQQAKTGIELMNENAALKAELEGFITAINDRDEIIKRYAAPGAKT